MSILGRTSYNLALNVSARVKFVRLTTVLTEKCLNCHFFVCKI